MVPCPVLFRKKSNRLILLQAHCLHVEVHFLGHGRLFRPWNNEVTFATSFCCNEPLPVASPEHLQGHLWLRGLVAAQDRRGYAVAACCVVQPLILPGQRNGTCVAQLKQGFGIFVSVLIGVTELRHILGNVGAQGSIIICELEVLVAPQRVPWPLSSAVHVHAGAAIASLCRLLSIGSCLREWASHCGDHGPTVSLGPHQARHPLHLWHLALWPSLSLVATCSA